MPKRDIVFLMDQSKTIWTSDSLGARWHVLRNLVALVYQDEEKAITAYRGKRSDIRQTRFAIIPFGGEQETKEYLEDFPLRWFDRTQQTRFRDDYLNKLITQSQNYQKMASHTDFEPAFSRLGKAPIAWRKDADHYVFLITDGRYDPENNPRLDSTETDKFAALLDMLHKHIGNWPVYFMVMGDSNYHRASNREKPREMMERLAKALPLPEKLGGNSPRPFFPNPSSMPNNLLPIISEDNAWIRQQLQSHLETILRSSLPIPVLPPTNSKIELPQNDPRHAEIFLEVSPQISTSDLLGKLTLSLETEQGYRVAKLLPAAPIMKNILSFSHTLIVDRDDLLGLIASADSTQPLLLKRWGLKLHDHAITVKTVNLHMRHNWSVYVDRCELVPLYSERNPLRRIFRWTEPLRYKLAVQVRAAHPCKGELQRRRLQVFVDDEDYDFVCNEKPLREGWFITVGSDTIRNTRHTYTWQKEIAHQDIFATRVGRPIAVRFVLEDLYDYSINLQPEVPINGAPVDTLIARE